MEEKRYWDSDNDDAGKEIVKRAKAMLKQLDKQLSQSEDERASLEHQIEIENTRKNSIKASLKAMRLTKTSIVQQVTGYVSDRKIEEDSLVTGIDQIFQEYHIYGTISWW